MFDAMTQFRKRLKDGDILLGSGIHLTDPLAFGLPASGLGSNFLIAREDFYFVLRRVVGRGSVPRRPMPPAGFDWSG